MYDISYFSKFRVRHAKDFDDQLIQSSQKLKPLFKYLIETRRRYKDQSLAEKDYTVDYDHIMSLLPVDDQK